MSKEGDLWDDSALIDAFDIAMSKYKRMHGKKNSQANVPTIVDQSGDGAVKDAEKNSNATSNTRTETAEAQDVQPVEQNHSVHSQAPEPYIESSNNLPIQEKQDGHKGYSVSAEHYNQLLTLYYEVEEKRQNILQQLQQFESWNYQYPAENSGIAAQLGTSSTSQGCPILTSQASHSTVACSCCPYVCQSLVTPCTSYPCCSLGGTCVGKTSGETNDAMAHGNSSTVIDSDTVKTAMEAAEIAISSITTKTSTNPNGNEEEKKDGEKDMNRSSNCETDLSVLLNAWYSAGFYTGKYLMEQSIAKKQH